MTSPHQARLLAKRALIQRLNASQKRGLLQAGFTLVELLIVVVILGILSAIAIPNFVGIRDKAQTNADKASASGDARACAAAVVAGGPYPTLKTGTCSGTGGSFTAGTTTVTVDSGGSVSGI